MAAGTWQPWEETEADRVTAWRLEGLLRAGYPVSIAERLAVRHDVDLHEAVELVARGCAHATAALILL